MDPFTRKLFEISTQLDSGNCSELIFLCKDFISQQSCIGKKDTDIFILLQQMCCIDENDTRLIEELLFYLGRNDLLLQHFQLTASAMIERLKNPAMEQISPYRCLLYKLGNVITNSKLGEIKRNCTQIIPKARVEKVKSLLDVFIELEKKYVISEDNVDYLEQMSHYLKDEEFDALISEYQIRKAADSDLISTDDVRKSSTHKTEKTKGEKLPPNPQGQPDNFPGCHSPLHVNMVYSMENKIHGICLVISNLNFSKARRNHGQQRFNDRKGTEKDEESLHIIFSKLGFKVHIKKNLEGEEILQTINLFKEPSKHENSDCFICCVLSHGDRGIIYGTDGKSVLIRNLTFSFCSSQCSTLIGKPKLFFIQACQGKEHQQLVSLQTDACKTSDGSNISEDLIPGEPDFLLGMATTLHCVSYRDPNHGSWYIQSLCKHLDESYKSQEDIISTLTKVNHELSQKRVDTLSATQMPQPWTTLTRKLVFN
ncbi:caspase-8-like isoform X2 [Dendrobates tinctorius]|uniref:caspase-8-like isoform X2 n=1 Tax=Dendrobates tinctorius TaxID=92724 RepID=UPI003CC99337